MAKPVKIKLATMAPKGSVFYRTLKHMGDVWRKVSNNQVRLKIYPGGVAGSDRDVIRKIKLGTVNAGMVTSSGLAAVDKAVNVFQIPATFGSKEELDYLVSKIGPKVAAIYEAQGLIVLSWGEAGWIRFLSKSPMIDPKDRAKHKLFIFSGNPDQVTLWKSAGFNVVPLPVTEIATGLQTGLITAVPATAQTALMFQWYKHAPHLSGYAWSPLMGAIVVDKRVWDNVDPSIRPLLKSIAVECGKQLLAEARPGEEKAITAMKARGLKVHEVSQEMVKEWNSLADLAKDQLRGGYVATALYDEAKAHLEDYRRSKKSTAP